MPTHKRAQDQVPMGIALHRELLEMAKKSAARMGVPLSGFVRYAIALAVGYSPAQAKIYGLHGAALRYMQGADGGWKAGESVVDFGNETLTDYRKEGNKVPMQPIMPTLLERLRLATGERGRKTELAAAMGVAPQKITDWLSARVEPSGETTLRLLEWVTADEAKYKTKSPASVIAPAGPTDPSKERNENETHSGPP